jgi:glycosyltransferase involved in cell wall biosynthesis
MLNRIRNKKIIVDIHDVIQHYGYKLSLWSKFIINKWLCLANGIIVHNFTNVGYMENVLKLAKEKIHILPFGLIQLTDKQINYAIPSDKPILLFFGRICQYKGIEYLIDAISIVKKDIFNLKVIIAGKGKYDFGASKIINDETYEIMNYYIPNEQLARLINRSTVIVCPYIEATQSGVIMTAFAFNKPVVATNVGGIPEVVEDGVTGRLVPPKNPQKLAKAIIDLLNNPEKRKTISENINKKFNNKEFKWEHIAEKTIEIYKSGTE